MEMFRKNQNCECHEFHTLGMFSERPPTVSNLLLKSHFRVFDTLNLDHDLLLRWSVIQFTYHHYGITIRTITDDIPQLLKYTD